MKKILIKTFVNTLCVAFILDMIFFGVLMLISFSDSTKPELQMLLPKAMSILAVIFFVLFIILLFLIDKYRDILIKKDRA